MTNEPQPDLLAAYPATLLTAGNLAVLVSASGQRGVRDYRAAPTADAGAWVKRAKACARYAVALLRAAAKPVFFPTCRVGEEPWRPVSRLGEIRLALSKETDDLDEARAVRATSEAAAAEGCFKSSSEASAKAVAAAPTLLDILGPPLKLQRRAPQRMRCPFDFDVQDPGMDDPHIRRG